VTYSDELGRRRVIQRRVATRTEGKILLKKLLREIEDHGARILDGDRMTFKDLAKVYEEKRLFEPTITPSGKAIGLKSYKSVRRRLKNLKLHFGNKRIRGITHADIETYKLERLNTPTILRKAARTEADVNRDLQLLRNVLNFAVRQGWLVQNPFSLGEPLISMAAEVRRERVLSRDEEVRLLEVCTGSIAHLKPILICALDTAMRRGEIFKMRWKAVDFFNNEITVRATTTKTGKPRVVPISIRLREELLKIKALAPDDPEERVFGISDVKKSFVKACRVAGIEDFRFHDCRHTAITRWIEQGLPPMQVMSISGHTQMQTFARYVNADRTVLKRAAAAMNAFHALGEENVTADFIH
jgi:integrase